MIGEGADLTARLLDLIPITFFLYILVLQKLLSTLGTFAKFPVIGEADLTARLPDLVPMDYLLYYCYENCCQILEILK